MKYIFPLAFILCLNAYGAARVETFKCQSRDGLELNVQASITDSTNYQISVLRNGYPIMRNNNPDIVFHSDGEMTALRASNHTDVLIMYSNKSLWIGEFWNDNVYYDLNCFSL